MYCLFILLLLQTILSCHCQVSFTITRSESGDEVESSLTSADYCSAIHGYLNGSQCKCDTRNTFSLEHQRCIDYYNGKNIESLSFIFSPAQQTICIVYCTDQLHHRLYRLYIVYGYIQKLAIYFNILVFPRVWHRPPQWAGQSHTAIYRLGPVQCIYTAACIQPIAISLGY